MPQDESHTADTSRSTVAVVTARARVLSRPSSGPGLILRRARFLALFRFAFALAGHAGGRPWAPSQQPPALLALHLPRLALRGGAASASASASASGVELADTHNGAFEEVVCVGGSQEEGRFEELGENSSEDAHSESALADASLSPSVQYFLTRCPSGRADSGIYIGSCRWFLGSLVEESMHGEVSMQELRKVFDVIRASALELEPGFFNLFMTMVSMRAQHGDACVEDGWRIIEWLKAANASRPLDWGLDIAPRTNGFESANHVSSSRSACWASPLFPFGGVDDYPRLRLVPCVQIRLQSPMNAREYAGRQANTYVRVRSFRTWF